MNIDVSSRKDGDNVEDNEEEEDVNATAKAPVGISSGRLIRDAEGRVIGFETPEDDAAAGSSNSVSGPSNTKGSSSASGRKRKSGAVDEETTPWGARMPDDRSVAPVTAKTPVVQGEFSSGTLLFWTAPKYITT